MLVDLSGIPAEIDIDESSGTVAVNAAATYGKVAPALDLAGFALHNVGSLPHISVAGATATGTHGSGSGLGSLCTVVRALEILGSDGAVRTLNHDSVDFPGAVIHLGLLGVVTRVTLELEPSYRMRQDVYGPMPWNTYVDNLEEIHAAGYSVSAFTRSGETVHEILVKSRIPDGARDIDIVKDLSGAPRLPGDPGGASVTERDGSVGPWWDRLPHFPIASTPSVGSELQSEHFVPLRHAGATLEAVRAHAPRLLTLLHVSELRTIAGDGLWLSPTQGEDVLCIAFTWKKVPGAVAELLVDIERSLTTFSARPHWGKLSSLDRDAISDLYPRLPEFCRLVTEFDPDRKFASPFSERLLGI